MKLLIVLSGSLLCFTAGAQNGSVQQLRRSEGSIQRQLSGTKPRDGMDVLNYVNPFVGTGAHGHTYPGASAPFGMMQLSPDTRYEGWDGCSGYHYSDSVIYGFSHTHLSGTGVPDYGDLLVVPQMSQAISDPGYSFKGGYGASFRHENETASPGYYGVTFDNGIHADLTVSERSGMHRYTFPEGTGKRFILLDLDHRDQLLAVDAEVMDQQTVQGSRISRAWAVEQHFYFYLQSNVPFEEAKEINAGGRNKLLLTFPETTNEILLRVGMSAVDKAGAKRNLEQEIPAWNFDQVRTLAENNWRKELNKINVTSRNKNDLINFYTALYHAFLNPNLFSDSDGRYRGRDMNIHQLPEGEKQYTVFSLWDTYRAAHPLFTITQQRRTVDFIKTFQRQYAEGGDLPVWELAGNETECMIGYHSVSVIADAYMKDIPGFSIDPFIEAVVATSTFDEFGKKAFRSQGFIGVNDEPESVSKTLEYAYDDFCIYLILTKAKKEGKKIDDALIEGYKSSALNFVNCFDPDSGFMRGRRSGLWFSPFLPEEVNFNYTEANSWQYSLYAPHAMGVLTDLLGGKEQLENWLDRLFSTSSELSGRHQVDITGLIGQYAHGNEPSHHMAYLYNYTPSAYKTADIVDSILHHYYSPVPEGLSGNEDCGQMSAWYVLSSLGFYPIAPGSPNYDLGRPIFNQAVIRTDQGKRLTINYEGNSREARYIQSIEVNGTTLDRNYVTHNELVNGGSWQVKMGTTPTVTRTTAPSWNELPESFTAVPHFEQDVRVFDTELELSIAQPIKRDHYQIFYTLDGSDPKAKGATIYKKPFTIRTSTTVNAVVFNTKTRQFSAVVSNEFVQKQQGIHLTIDANYANQYAAGGKDALIDGISGGVEYRTGDWQGYWGQDIRADIHFDTPRDLSSISVSCLQDMRSWIFLPKKVVYTVQYADGSEKTYEVGEEVDRLAESEVKRKENYAVSIAPGKVTGFKIHVVNYGTCPDWHLGAGGDTWLFADEITFN